MLNKIINLLNSQENYISSIKEDLLNSKKGIKVLNDILNDIYKIKVIMGIAEDYLDIEDIMKIQKYLFNNVIEQLSMELNYIGNIKLSFDETTYPSAIEVSIISLEGSERVVLLLDIYRKEIYSIPNEILNNVKNEIKKIDEDIQEVKKEIEKYEVYVENPILSAGDNLIKTTTILFTKKKTKEKLKKELIELDKELLYLNSEKINKNIGLEKIKNENAEISLSKDKIIKRLESGYGFKLEID